MERENPLTINGMTADSYDLARDPTGIIGITLAEELYRSFGWRAFTRRDDSRNNGADEPQRWGGIARVALMRFNEQAPGETIHLRELKRRLGEIRTAGYNVPAYSHLSKDKVWSLLNNVRRDIREKAREYCPSVLAAINLDNTKIRCGAGL